MSYLTDDEILGIKVVTLLECEIFGRLDCSNCLRKDELNCNLEQDDISVLYDEDLGEFNTCPINFIPSSVSFFKKKYDYIQRFPNSVDKFEDSSPRFNEAIRVYEEYKRLRFDE